MKQWYIHTGSLSGIFKGATPEEAFRAALDEAGNVTMGHIMEICEVVTLDQMLFANTPDMMLAIGLKPYPVHEPGAHVDDPIN